MSNQIFSLMMKNQDNHSIIQIKVQTKYQLFKDDYEKILEELNEALAA